MKKFILNKNYLFASIILLVLINILANFFYKRIDVTAEKRYSLSEHSKNILKNLKEPIEIEVFLKGQFPAGFKRLANATKDFLDECKSYSNGKLSYIYTEPLAGLNDSTGAYLMDSIKYFYDIQASVVGDMQTKVGDEQKSKLVLPGAIVKGNTKTAGVNLLRGTQQFGTNEEQLAEMYNQVESGLEYKFIDAINKVSQTKTPNIGWALGNGEAWGYNIDDAFQTLRGKSKATNYYNLDTINIPKINIIPENLDALIILKPTSRFSDLDKLKIDQYVMHGGSVFWMVDNMYAEFDSLMRSKNQGFIAFDRGLNIDDLLFHYGARINQNLLQDLNSDKLPLQQGNSSAGEQTQLFPFSFMPILNGSNNVITKNLDGIRALFPNTLDTIYTPGIKKTILLKSSSNARIIGVPYKVDFEFMQYAEDKSKFTVKDTAVAALLEGNFTSFYQNRLSADLDNALKIAKQPFLEKAIKPGKMIVVADGDIATNFLSSEKGPLKMGENLYTHITYANKDFYLNCIEYLTGNKNILEARSKDFTLRLLDPVKKENNANKWKILSTILPIIILILFGFIYNEIRKKKYII